MILCNTAHKKRYLSLLAAVLCISVARGAQKEPDLSGFILVDTIDTVIYGEVETAIITQSELERVSLDGSGAPYPKSDVIFENLIYLDAKKIGISDEGSVDRYLRAIQDDNNLTLDQLKQVFENSGYLYEEARSYLGKMGAIRSMLDYKINSKLIVSEEKAKKYYEAHPVMRSEAYRIQRAVVPYTEHTRTAVGQDLAKQFSLGSSFDHLDWSDPFWINKDDIAESMQFICTLKVGGIAKPRSVEGGFELFRLVDKRGPELMSLEDRYEEIAQELKKELYDTLFQDYKKELYEHASIVSVAGA